MGKFSQVFTSFYKFSQVFTSFHNLSNESTRLMAMALFLSRSPPISFSAIPLDSHGQVRNPAGNPSCPVNKFWRQNMLKATFISSPASPRLHLDQTPFGLISAQILDQ